MTGITWMEDDLVPCTPEEHSRMLREAMEKFAHLLPSREEEPCECLTCSLWNRYVA